MNDDKRRVGLMESFHDCERLYDETNIYGKMNYADVGFLTARKLIPELLAELALLRARERPLLALVRAVASGEPLHPNFVEQARGWLQAEEERDTDGA